MLLGKPTKNNQLISAVKAAHDEYSINMLEVFYILAGFNDVLASCFIELIVLAEPEFQGFLFDFLEPQLQLNSVFLGAKDIYKQIYGQLCRWNVEIVKS